MAILEGRAASPSPKGVAASPTQKGVAVGIQRKGTLLLAASRSLAVRWGLNHAVKDSIQIKKPPDSGTGEGTVSRVTWEPTT
jgi:hypothetical protein